MAFYIRPSLFHFWYSALLLYDLLSQKSGERLNWNGMSESKGEEYNLEEDTMETRYGYESTQIPSGLLIVIFFILSLIIANG